MLHHNSGPPGDREVYFRTSFQEFLFTFFFFFMGAGRAGLYSYNASDISGVTRVFPCVSSHAAFSLPPPPVVLHFQMPCHNSTWMCFSQLSSAPAGKTNFLKHRKHPAENILIKQTPHKMLFWGEEPAPPSLSTLCRETGEDKPAGRSHILMGLCCGWFSAGHTDSVPGPLIWPGFS